MDNITWIFFDMGSTLLDETESYKAWFRNASELTGGALSAQEIEQEYCVGMARFAPTVGGQLRAHGFIVDNATHLYPHDLDKPYPETERILKQLSHKYKLGIIANQKLGAEARLKGFGLQQYFDVIVASAEAGVAKPDPRIFSLALAQANCRPDQAAMIGDRLDNDIIPAKALGFTTIHIRQGYGKLQVPRSPDERPDATVDSLLHLLELLQ